MTMVTTNKPWHRLMPLGVLALLMVVTSACVATNQDVGGFSAEASYTLRSGKQLTGDQVVLAYKITLEPDSMVEGDMTLTGNKVRLNGEVDGDVVVVSDRVTVGDTAHVTGDLVVCAKDLQRSDMARIDGEFKEECTNSGRVSARNLLESGWDSWQGSVFFRVSSVIVGALLFGAVAALITTVFPRPLVRMSESVQRSPLTAGGVGFLTMLVAIGLTVVYGISLILLLPVVLMPLVLVGWLVIGVLSLLGWAALASPVGVWVFRMLRMDHQPRMVAAAVGGIVLALLLRVWSVFWFTFWIGLVASIILGSIGLGAVILTRVGTRPFPRPDA